MMVRMRRVAERVDLAVNEVVRRAAYAMSRDADILAFLLQLNPTCAAKEAAGESITPPGLPLPVDERGSL